MPKNKDGDVVEIPPKDEEELILEKLVFGDLAGLESNLRKVDNLYDFDDEEEVVDEIDNVDDDNGDDSDGLDDVQDEDLFYIDEGVQGDDDSERMDRSEERRVGKECRL